MDIKEIVVAYLKEHGYDGLCGEGCGCGLGDLFPCLVSGEIDGYCKAAKKKIATAEDVVDGDYEFEVGDIIYVEADDEEK